MKEKISIGIDLGTTNSVITKFSAAGCEVIRDRDGSNITPSVVSWDGDGKMYIGNIAKNMRQACPESTISVIKRFMGVAESEYRADKNYVGKVKIKGKTEVFSPEQISAMVLTHMRDFALEYCGDCEVESVIVTVPAYFREEQKTATLTAAKMAFTGVPNINLIAEPTSAAIAYTEKMSIADGDTFLVYDLGGGTFDISAVHYSENTFSVLAVGGDDKIGGEDFDCEIIRYVCDKINQKHGSEINPADPLIKAKYSQQCVNAKHNLSSMNSTNIMIIDVVNGNMINENITISKTIEETNKVIQQVKDKDYEIKQILLVGGSTRIPLVSEALSELGLEVSKVGINPDEVVSVGASIEAARRANPSASETVILDATSHAYGIMSLDDNRGSSLYFSVIIPKNSSYPTSLSNDYMTANDNQAEINLSIYQTNEYEEGTELNVMEEAGVEPLKTFKLKLKPGTKKGTFITVNLDLDDNCILNASGIVKYATGDEKFSITASGKKILDAVSIKKQTQKLNEMQAEQAQISNDEDIIEQAKKLCRTMQKEKQNVSEIQSAISKKDIEKLKNILGL